MSDNGEKVFIEMGQRQREESDQDQTEETLSLLTFCIEKDWYCVPSSQVKEVTRIPKITPVPGTPDYILGVAHHSGEILSVIDIKPYIPHSFEYLSSYFLRCTLAGSWVGEDHLTDSECQEVVFLGLGKAGLQ